MLLGNEIALGWAVGAMNRHLPCVGAVPFPSWKGIALRFPVFLPLPAAPPGPLGRLATSGTQEGKGSGVGAVASYSNDHVNV